MVAAVRVVRSNPSHPSQTSSEISLAEYLKNRQHGDKAKLARALGCTPSAIDQVLREERPVVLFLDVAGQVLGGEERRKFPSRGFGA